MTMPYEAFRITFQSSEQCARACWSEAQSQAALADGLADALDGLRKFAGYAVERGVAPGFFQIAIDNTDEALAKYRENRHV